MIERFKSTSCEGREREGQPSGSRRRRRWREKEQGKKRENTFNRSFDPNIKIERLLTAFSDTRNRTSAHALHATFASDLLLYICCYSLSLLSPLYACMHSFNNIQNNFSPKLLLQSTIQSHHCIRCN